MNYTVKHYHDKIFNVNPYEKPVVPSVYGITADSPREAAIIAHGFYNGYSIDEITDDSVQPFRTIRNRLQDAVKETPVGKNTEKHSIFLYDGIAGHVIIVDRLD
ncbi:MAG: hypothetical protein IKO36_07270 [Bacteroidaceae bacterium]|nr:hypothetical protein [Bacteroidaceae bacterium]